MTLSLTESYPRLWTLESGVVMVVTDLHGDWDAYRRYRDRFVALHTAGQADGLIFIGDLIHGEASGEDRSLEIILDLLALRNTYGQAVIILCGNHEMPHIYGINLSRGDVEYTPPFETALSQSDRRDDIIALFDSLPFYLRTPAGVSITHAGAPSIIANPGSAQKLFTWDHQKLIDWANEIISAEDIAALRNGYAKLHGEDVSYDDLARHYLAVSSPNDPRYNDLLRAFVAGGHPDFDQLLWPALFTRNEEQYGLGSYKIFLDALLKGLSKDYRPQEVLVTGHMTVQGGYKIIAGRQLRLASAPHARPRSAGQYLLFDTARPIKKAIELLTGLHSVFTG